MRNSLILFLTFSLFVSCSKISERPNFIIILTDDQGWGDLELTGNPVLKTPNLNDLADTGSFLNSFYLIGIPGIIYAILYAITHICFVYSIQNTAVANTLVLIASAPIFAALFSVFILKEIPSLFTWIVILIAMFAMIIIGVGSFTTTGLYGDLMALIVAIGMGFSMVLVRLFKNKDLVPACLLGCLISALYALPFGINFDLNNNQFILILIMCLILLPIPFMIMTISPKFAPAHEVALIFLLESVLGTTWVWFIIQEVPPLNTIIGGILLLGSVTIFIYQTTKKSN